MWIVLRNVIVLKAFRNHRWLLVGVSVSEINLSINGYDGLERG